MTYSDNNSTEISAAKLRPVRELWVVRALSGLAITAACETIYANKPDPTIEVRRPGRRRPPLLDLIVKRELRGVPDSPFIAANDIMDILLDRMPSLKETRPVEIEAITSHRSAQGDGFVRLQLSDTAYRQSRAEKQEMHLILQQELEQRVGHRLEWQEPRLHAITIAYVPAPLPATTLTDTQGLVIKLFPDMGVLDPVSQPNRE